MNKLVLGLVLLASCSSSHDASVIGDGGTNPDAGAPVADAGVNAMPDARIGSDVPDPVDEPSLPCAGTLAFPNVPVVTTFNQPKIAIADVDGDGIPDIVEADTYPLMHIEIGVGDGTFLPAVAYTLSDFPMSLAVADVNGDGALDVVTVGQTKTVEVLLNHGDGTFAASVSYQVANGPEAIAIGDLSGDGKPEIVVTHETLRISVIPNLGNGVFGIPVVYDASTYPNQVAIGDVTGDGKADVVVTDDTVDATVSVYANTGSGGLAPRVAYPTSAEPRGLALVNIVGDHALDIVLSTHTPESNFQQQVSVMENVGGTFPSEHTYVVGGTYTAPLSIADVDDDGILDVVAVGSAIDYTQSISVAYGLSGGGFAMSVPYRTMFATGTSVADLDGDGHLDIVVQTSAGAAPMLNNGDGTFAQPTPFTVPFSPNNVAVRDLDGDGFDDVVVDGVDNNGAYGGVYFGDGHGNLEPVIEVPATFSPMPIQLGDIDGDGQPDIIMPDRSQPSATVWIAHGRTFTTSIATLPYNAQVATLVDLDHDGVRELVGVSYDGKLAVMKFHSNGTFTATAPVAVGVPSGIAYGDVNGDGNQDVVVSSNAGVMTTFLGDGNGGWTSTAVSTGHQGSIALGDVDGDHVLDLVTNSEVEHGNGDGTFVFAPYDQFGGADSIHLRDVNGDSHLDVIASTSGLLTVALNNGDGTYSFREYSSGNRNTVAVGDFDKDGRPDFVTATSGTRNEVTLQFGRCVP